MSQIGRIDPNWDWHVSIDYCLDKVHEYDRRLAKPGIPDEVKNAMIADREKHLEMATDLCLKYVDLNDLIHSSNQKNDL